MTPARLAEMKALEAAATAGPWDRRIAGIEGDNYVAATGPWYRTARNENNLHEDAAFIATARSFVPEAIEEIERLSLARDWNDCNDAETIRGLTVEVAALTALVPTPEDEAIDRAVRDHVAELQQEVIRLNGENNARRERWERLKAAAGALVTKLEGPWSFDGPDMDTELGALKAELEAQR